MSASPRLCVLEMEQEPLTYVVSKPARNAKKRHAVGINAILAQRSTRVGICLSAVACGLVYYLLVDNCGTGMVAGSKRRKERHTLRYECPSTTHLAENADRSFDTDYEKASKKLLDQNTTEFLSHFRKNNFDAWGKSYEEVKSGMYHWKQKYIAPYLQSGSSIYESACGIGLNIYLTLEIVQETTGVNGVVVYGNEYVPSSAVQANAIYDQQLPHKSTKGVICAADSSRLSSFVPENSFDVVFTGYLSTILDPLELNYTSSHKNFRQYRKLCNEAEEYRSENEEAKNSKWRSVKLLEVAQKRQEDWFAKWVSEMIRIAKPGAPVVIEQVSQPYCMDQEDYGGVPREWWPIAIERYGWGVDASSLAMETDRVFSDSDTLQNQSRYHVFMQKQAESSG